MILRVCFSCTQYLVCHAHSSGRRIFAHRCDVCLSLVLPFPLLLSFFLAFGSSPSHVGSKVAWGPTCAGIEFCLVLVVQACDVMASFNDIFDAAYRAVLPGWRLLPWELGLHGIVLAGQGPGLPDIGPLSPNVPLPCDKRSDLQKRTCYHRWVLRPPRLRPDSHQREVLGAMYRGPETKAVTVQAKPSTTDQVVLLKNAAVAADDPRNRCVAGFASWCLHARFRVGDALPRSSRSLMFPLVIVVEVAGSSRQRAPDTAQLHHASRSRALLSPTGCQVRGWLQGRASLGFDVGS